MEKLITKTPLEKRIFSIVSPIIKDLGFELIRIRLLDNKSNLMQIMVDSPEMNITVDECARISNEISAVLDVEDPYDDTYDLEISSPGVDRPLTRLHDFDQWIGYEAKLEIAEAIDGQKRFKGILRGTDNDEILINIDVGTIGLKFEWLLEAKLVLTEKLIKKSLQNQKNITPNKDNFDFNEKQKVEGIK